jgi:protein-tyrosine-phosphatase
LKILVLCHGNINRSPLCATVLKTMFPKLEVKQAALKEFKRPERAGAKMRRAAAAKGYDLEDHRSQPITKELLEWADKVIIMDNGNMKRLREFAGKHNLGYTYSFLSSYLLPPKLKIADPAFMADGTPEFKQVVDDIISASLGLGWDISAENKDLT